MGRAHTVRLIASVILLTGCLSNADREQAIESTAASTTSTTIPISNFDFRVDPASPDRANADNIVATLKVMELDFPVNPGTVVILYSATDDSVAWAYGITREITCFQDRSEINIRNNLALANECGILMRLDKEPACDEVDLCKTRQMMAAHEFFHVVQYQTLLKGEELYFNSWLWEGAADYVGYAYTYGESPGTLSPAEIHEFRSNLKNLARDPNLDGGLNRMQILINYGPGQQKGPLPRWYLYLYNKAFLAVTLLVEKFGTDAVLFDYVRNTAETHDFEKAFQLTFGVTQDEFSTEFETWLKAL